MPNNPKAILRNLRQKSPLILNITNLVTMDFIANGLLSLGASPIMSQAVDELDELIKIANALIINMGTLNTHWIELANRAAEIATQDKCPIIFDPVGAGATTYRTKTAREFLNHYPLSIIRGNTSEILALTESSIQTKGVDSQHDTVQSLDTIKNLAKTHPNTVFAISGQTDIVIQNDRSVQIGGGSSLTPKVTGSGCLLTALMGAFNAAHNDPYEASVIAMQFYKNCAEHAAIQAIGPGSFKMNLIDALSNL